MCLRSVFHFLTIFEISTKQIKHCLHRTCQQVFYVSGDKESCSYFKAIDLFWGCSWLCFERMSKMPILSTCEWACIWKILSCLSCGCHYLVKEAFQYATVSHPGLIYKCFVSVLGECVSTIYAYNSLLGVYLLQGYGKCLWKAHGFFKANGGCGYIHKPKFLLENDANGAIFNPKLHHAVKEIFKVNYNLLHLCLKLVEIKKCVACIFWAFSVANLQQQILRKSKYMTTGLGCQWVDLNEEAIQGTWFSYVNFTLHGSCLI